MASARAPVVGWPGRASEPRNAVRADLGASAASRVRAGPRVPPVRRVRPPGDCADGELGIVLLNPYEGIGYARDGDFSFVVP